MLRRRLGAMEAWAARIAPPGSWVRRLVITATVVILGGAAWLAVRNLPEGTEVSIGPVVVLAVATSATLLLNAMEHAATARLAGGRETLLAALKVSVYGNVANLLPVPGSVVVRVQALRRRGHAGRVALSATAAVGVCWISVSILLGGVLLLTARPLLGSLLVASATAGVVVCVLWGRKLPAEHPAPIWVQVVLIEAGKVAVQALRMHLALLAVGASPSVGQSAAIGISVSVSSATAFLPAGLGVREAIATGLGALVGLPAAVGLLATLVDRAAGLVMAIPLSAIVLMIPDSSHPVDLDVDGLEHVDDDLYEADART
jgi:uncharacterized membrane protein YbhN (UPF0104 family)